MKRDYGIFQVGLKILLRRGNEVLLLRDDHGLDLPGGRIDNVEYRTPLEKIIAREVREELGSKVKYHLGNPILHFRRVRRLKGVNPRHVFLVVYDARWRTGEIKLSFEHSEYMWVDPKTYRLKRTDFGQEEEYRALKKYFSQK